MFMGKPFSIATISDNSVSKRYEKEAEYENCRWWK
jgi:hypothetical protein